MGRYFETGLNVLVRRWPKNEFTFMFAATDFKRHKVMKNRILKLAVHLFLRHTVSEQHSYILMYFFVIDIPTYIYIYGTLYF